MRPCSIHHDRSRQLCSVSLCNAGHLSAFYPDTDDTSKVLLALEWAQGSDPGGQSSEERRALEWLVAMQSSDGGWAAFDVDNNAEILTHVPFADPAPRMTQR